MIAPIFVHINVQMLEKNSIHFTAVVTSMNKISEPWLASLLGQVGGNERISEGPGDYVLILKAYHRITEVYSLMALSERILTCKSTGISIDSEPAYFLLQFK